MRDHPPRRDTGAVRKADVLLYQTLRQEEVRTAAGPSALLPPSTAEPVRRPRAGRGRREPPAAGGWRPRRGGLRPAAELCRSALPWLGIPLPVLGPRSRGEIRVDSEGHCVGAGFRALRRRHIAVRQRSCGGCHFASEQQMRRDSLFFAEWAPPF